jgi:hypothetical protein
MVHHSIRSASKSHRTHGSAHAARLCACAGFFLAAALASASAGAQQGSSQGSPALLNPQPHPTSVILPAANHGPDANDRMEMQDQKLKRAGFDAANAERKRQLDSDSAMLLKLASELKAEIDKTPPDTLSLSIVRKAEDIEHLAHSVQVKMKLTVGTD